MGKTSPVPHLEAKPLKNSRRCVHDQVTREGETTILHLAVDAASAKAAVPDGAALCDGWGTDPWHTITDAHDAAEAPCAPIALGHAARSDDTHHAGARAQTASSGPALCGRVPRCGAC